MIDNLAQVNNGIDKWLDEMEDLALGAMRGMAVEAFSFVVHGTPEWSGNLTSNWRLTVGGPAVGYSPSLWKEESFGSLAIDKQPYSSRVSPNGAAIHYAMTIAKTQLQFARLGAPIYITNTAPYADDVQNDIVGYRRTSRVRVANRPIHMTYAAARKFGGPGDISATRAVQLSKAVLA